MKNILILVALCSSPALAQRVSTDLLTARPVAAPSPAGKAKPTALQGYMDYSPFTRTWTWKLRYPQPRKD